MGLFLTIMYIFRLNYNSNLLEKRENILIENFFTKNDIATDAFKNYSKKFSTEYEEYIGILDIPSINLVTGVVSPISKYNDIKYNVEILNNSKMPDVKDSCLILAAHSGTSRVSYFHNLKNISLNDEVYIHYNQKRYSYKVISKYLELKDGDIEYSQQNDQQILVLTTCDENDKSKQLVVIAELFTIESWY